MKRDFFRQAMAFLLTAQMDAKSRGEIFDHKEALEGSPYRGMNRQSNPIFFPTKSQKIKAKRLAKTGGR